MGLCNKKMASRGAGKDKTKRSGRLPPDASPVSSAVSPRTVAKEPAPAATASSPQQAARSSSVAAAAASASPAAAAASAAVSAPPVVVRTQGTTPVASSTSAPDIVSQTSGSDNAAGKPTQTAEVGRGSSSNSARSSRLDSGRNGASGEVACTSDETWSEKLREAAEQARQEEAGSWSDKLRLQEKELAEVRRQLAQLDSQMTEQRAQHERELNELRNDRSHKETADVTNRATTLTTATAAATLATDTEIWPPPRPARLEDADYPQFFEMLVYRKETVEQASHPVELSPPPVAAGINGSEVTNGVSELTTKEVRPLETYGGQERVDGRLQVTPCTSQPYQWIVSLLIRFPNGGGDRPAYRGTGCVLNFPNDDDNRAGGSHSSGGRRSRIVILTTASNLYSRRDGGTAVEVTVIPARDGIGAPYGTYSVAAGDIRIAPEYADREDEQFNYGALLLNADAVRSFGFGYAVLGDTQLNGRVVQSAGYPTDKADGTMWTRGGRATPLDAWSFHCGSADCSVGSGAPVWTWATHSFVLVGLQAPARRRPDATDDKAASGENIKCIRLSQSLLDSIGSWLAECSR